MFDTINQTHFINITYRFEIIEFPAVLVDTKTRTIIDHFQAYVKPTFNSQLSEFCTELTGITQVSSNIFIDLCLSDTCRYLSKMYCQFIFYNIIPIFPRSY